MKTQVQVQIFESLQLAGELAADEREEVETLLST